MVEPPDRRGYNAPDGLASRFSAPAKATQELQPAGDRPHSTSMSGRMSGKGRGLSGVWRTGGPQGAKQRGS
jgi:hypothetical protein